MAVTLGEVARHAGVSLATASRALNGSARTVGDALAGRVRASAEELGYLPNAPAQALARSSTATVGVLLHDIADPYFGALAKGATDTAAQAGLLTMVLNTGGDPATELRCIRMLHAQRVRAIVLAGSGYTDPAATAAIDAALAAYRAEGGVVAAVTDHGDGYDTVLPDNRGGAAALTRELLAAGYRDLAVVTGPARFRVSAERLAGVREALAEEGITLRQERVAEAEFSRDGGRRAAGVLLERGPGSGAGSARGRGRGPGPERPQAILALSDVCAVGVLAELRERGISVPDEIAVAGFDDIPLAADLAPALTTARMPLEQMGAAAIRLAMGEHRDAGGAGAAAGGAGAAAGGAGAAAGGSVAATGGSAGVAFQAGTGVPAGTAVTAGTGIAAGAAGRADGAANTPRTAGAARRTERTAVAEGAGAASTAAGGPDVAEATAGAGTAAAGTATVGIATTATTGHGAVRVLTLPVGLALRASTGHTARS
ncbi:LacI family DNA-binding transcriptional regulator [Streptacidiphilus sp. N1-12]|uniref:LacI family DNA-binding transcriptional regulator n=2 Tax=Streptacidiphilus alkalitolerans TaxID=3342712 RepID=A0ABV6W835_9ACTN